jgi:transposase
MAHSNDVRKIVIDAYLRGEKTTTISSLLNIPAPSLYAWIAKFKKTGVIEKNAPSRGAPQIISNEQFNAYLSIPENQEKTQDEMASDWDVCSLTICHMLKKNGYSRKKKTSLIKKQMHNNEVLTWTK